jgi:type I restriction enzyme, S subunit
MTPQGWPSVPLGDVISVAPDPRTVDRSRRYPNIGIFSFGRGVFQKQPIEGSTTSASTLYRIRSGQFVYSRLFAFEGAYGIVPENCDGFFVSNEFPTFDLDHSRVFSGYLEWLFKLPATWKEIAARSTGLGNRRQRVHPEQLLPHMIPLPPIHEQERIVARIDGVAARVREAQALRTQQHDRAKLLLLSAFHKIAAGVPRASMQEVGPLVRRPVTVSFDRAYPELGVRSFFKGTFSKPPLSALELGSKRVFWIEPGDLIFSNVFAWEGAIAIATPQDAGRVGSHRFMTCVPVPGRAEARFLLQYFQTDEGFGRIQDASPGGAGRNRTLGIEALAGIQVPLPKIEIQQWFSQLHAKVESLLTAQDGLAQLYAAMVPATLERMFSPQVAATTSLAHQNALARHNRLEVEGPRTLA